MDDDLEIYIRNSVNPCGNISDLVQIEKSSYGSFGKSVPCVILNTYHSKKIEFDEKDNYIELIEESKKKQKCISRRILSYG